MFDFSNKKQKKIFLRVVVIVLVLAMVIPMAYALIASLVGRAV
jgi:hypothetical protein